jgi:hypothetical protein
LDPLLRLARVGLAIYFFYGTSHSRLQKGIDTGETENILPVIEP